MERGKNAAFPCEVLALAFQLQPEGWDWHFPADVKDRAPQDVTFGTSLLYHKTAYNGAVKFWNAAKMAALPVSNGLRGRGGGVSAACEATGKKTEATRF